MSEGDLQIHQSRQDACGFLPENGSLYHGRNQVRKGDCLYLFTDGIIDQFGGDMGKKFLSKTAERCDPGNLPPADDRTI